MTPKLNKWISILPIFGWFAWLSLAIRTKGSHITATVIYSIPFVLMVVQWLANADLAPLVVVLEMVLWPFRLVHTWGYDNAPAVESPAGETVSLQPVAAASSRLEAIAGLETLEEPPSQTADESKNKPSAGQKAAAVAAVMIAGIVAGNAAGKAMDKGFAKFRTGQESTGRAFRPKKRKRKSGV